MESKYRDDGAGVYWDGTPEEEQVYLETVYSVDAIWEKIKEEREHRKLLGGAFCAGKWFHADLVSRTQHIGNESTARDQLASGGNLIDTLKDPLTSTAILWKTMDGSWVPMTCQLALDVIKAIKSMELATHQAAEAHRYTVASMDVAGRMAYDFQSTGWPATYEE